MEIFLMSFNNFRKLLRKKKLFTNSSLISNGMTNEYMAYVY